MERADRPFRCGYSLVELVVVIAVMGLVSAAGIRALAGQLNRLAVRDAVAEADGGVARARDEALARHGIVTVRIDTTDGTLTVRYHGVRLARYAIEHEHGVSLATTRDSIAFDARGLGYGAANFTLVARRGAAAETLVVSRLGRTRR